MFKVNQLSITLKGKKILNDLNFEIDHGQIAIFLGGSGAGKSTLLRILNNLEKYDSGIFRLDGATLNLAKVNHDHTLGMVFQHFNLFDHLSVEDNIISTLVNSKGIIKKEAQSISSALLNRYGLKDHSNVYVSQLSGGQKQRLAIARTLSVDPKIICLDEPTSALDPRLTCKVAKYITELAEEGRIVILTTHDMNLLEQLEGHLFLMEEGSIIENATKKECIANPGRYPKLQNFLKGI
ncbi:MAG: amino acid ABC transporter ATP-binding protein [Parachlamydiaceae bacterium]|nr:amino acid ABC transporter ATP-binding protein [Parachlamydiaceae bacterium]